MDLSAILVAIPCGLIAGGFPELSLDPPGAQLDRCKGVLDLMGDPTRNIPPGGHPLRRDKVGHIVESQNVALVFTFSALARGQSHQQGFGYAPTGHPDFVLGGLGIAVLQSFKQRSEFGNRNLQWNALGILFQLQNAFRRFIDK